MTVETRLLTAGKQVSGIYPIKGDVISELVPGGCPLTIILSLPTESLGITQEMIGHVTQTIKEEVSGLLVSYLL